MSDTPVDMAKVTQMLDAGWCVKLWRGGVAGYVAHGRHESIGVWERAKGRVLAQTIEANKGPDGMDAETLRELNDEDFDIQGEVLTEDFTPDQALTRLAYKVQGEILASGAIPETRSNAEIAAEIAAEIVRQLNLEGITIEQDRVNAARIVLDVLEGR